MALLFVDGFDHYSPISYGTIKWDGNVGGTSSWESTGGRRGGGCLKHGDYWNYTYKTLASNYTTLIIGFAFKYNWLSPPTMDPILNLYDASTSHVYLSLSSSTSYLSVYRGNGTLLGTYSVALSQNVWYYLELKVTISDSVGVVQLRVNNYLALDLSSQDTRNGANAYINKIGIKGKHNSTSNYFCAYYDDLYICDDSGAQNNNFLNDVRIDTILPSGAGATTQWSASAGSNYQCVDDAAFDNGTDYVYTDIVDEIDTYAYGDVPTGITNIKGIQINATAKRTDSGVATKIKPIARVGGTDYLQTEMTLSTSYVSSNTVVELNPGDSAAWEEADINGAEFGVKLSANPI